MKYARDIMNKTLITSNIDDPIEMLIELFLATNYKSIPIIDANEDCVGIVDEIGAIKIVAENNKAKEDKKVADYKHNFLEPNLVDAAKSLGELIPSMLKSPSKRLIVVSGSKKPLGIISPSNIIKAALGKLPQSTELKEKLDATAETAEKNWKGTITKDIFTQAFDKSPYIMILTDVDGIIVECSERFYSILGHKENTVIGNKLSQYFPSFAHNKLAQAMHTAREQGRCPTQPTAMLKIDGKYQNMEMAFSGVRDEDKKLRYYSAILRNINANEVGSSF